MVEAVGASPCGQRHVGKTPKGGVLPPRHGDQAGAERFQRGQDGVQLRRFTGIGDGNDDVVLAEAPQISVGSFHGMEKEGRRTGRGKGGGKLAADQAGFARSPSARTRGAFSGVRALSRSRTAASPAISVFRTSCASLMSAAGPVWERTDCVMGKRP